VVNDAGPFPNQQELNYGNREQDYRDQHILVERRVVCCMFGFVGHIYFKGLLIGLGTES
jgi:hypothetical protein